MNPIDIEKSFITLSASLIRRRFLTNRAVPKGEGFRALEERRLSYYEYRIERPFFWAVLSFLRVVPGKFLKNCPKSRSFLFAVVLTIDSRIITRYEARFFWVFAMESVQARPCDWCSAAHGPSSCPQASETHTKATHLDPANCQYSASCDESAWPPL